MFTKKFNRRLYLIVAVLLGAFVFGSSFALYAIWPSNRAEGYQPVQPIEFPHDAMAGKAAIPCLYCHTNAEREAFASIPPLTVCMNCHSHVKPTSPGGGLTKRMKDLFTYIDEKTGRPIKPVYWIKVHDLSDFAYFDHSRHTVGAKLECAECHGPVEQMRQVRRVYPFTMGWCLDCHKKPPKPERADGRETDGPITCSTCHR